MLRTVTRLAIWSIGNHAVRNLLPAAATADDVELVGLFSRNQSLVREQCDRYKCCTWESAEAMLGDGAIDTIYLAGPNGTHFAQGEQVLAAGKHLWCEKSLTAELAQTEHLIGLAQQKKLVIAEAFMFAYHPQFAALRALLASGEMGRVATITARFGFPHLAPTDIRYSRDLDGGALLDVGAYCLAAPLLLLGKAPLSTAGSVGSVAEFDVDTAGASVMRFRDGAIAIGDWGFGRCYRNEIEIWCDAGFIRVDRAFSKPIHLETTIETVRQANNERHVITIPGGTNHFSEMMRAFGVAASDDALRVRLAEQALRQAQAVRAVRQNRMLP